MIDRQIRIWLNLEKELGLALGEQQVESSSARIPPSLSPRSVEALQDEI
jgi:hypothetical protein